MKRRVKWIGLVSLVPMGVLIIFMAFVVYREIVASSEVKRKLDAITQAGDPIDNVSMAEFFERNTHKAGTDAWSEVLDLSQASSNLTVSSDLPSVGTGKFPHDLHPGSDWTDESRVSEYLNEVRPILKRIHLASEFPKPVWLPLHFDGYLTLLQPIQESRQLVRILELDMVYALYHKEPERALKDIVAMRSVADTFDWPWFFVAQYVSLSIHGFQWQSINRSLDWDVWNEEQLATLSGQVSTPVDTVKAWNAGFAGQVAMFNASVENIAKVLPSEMKDNPLWKLPIMPSTRLELLQAHEVLQRCIDQGEDRLVERSEATIKAQTDRNRISLTSVYLGVFMPADAMVAKTFDRQETSRRLTLTSLAVKRFQLKNKRWPKSLSELSDIGLVDKDWSTTKRAPFGYAVDGDKAFVWSYEPFKGTVVSNTRPNIDSDGEFDTTSFVVSIR